MLKVQTLVELLHASTPYAPPGFEQTALYSTNSLVASLLILGSLLLTLLLSTMAFFGNVLKQRSAQNVLRWRRDGAPVLARPLLSGRSHCFISHNWGTGQDQSRTIKGALCGLVPSLRVWLDVDDMRSKAGTKATNTSNFGAVIDTTETMIAFMSGSRRRGSVRGASAHAAHAHAAPRAGGKASSTAPGASQASERSDYFCSPPCQQELRRAMSTKTPIVWVLETDPAHGGIAIESHLHDCPDDIRPTLEAAITAHEVIDWHRIRSFQDTSLRLILQRVLAKEAEARVADDVYVPTEITRAPMRLHPPPPPHKFHVWVSEHNPGAAELMDELDKWMVRGASLYRPHPCPRLTPPQPPPQPTPCPSPPQVRRKLKKRRSGKSAEGGFSRFGRSGRAAVQKTQRLVCGPWAMLNAPVRRLGIGAVLADNMCGGVYSTMAGRAVGGEPLPLGDLSPLAAVTLPPAMRHAVGIAQEAIYFAFAYPACVAERKANAEAAIDAVTAAAARGEAGGGEAGGGEAGGGEAGGEGEGEAAEAAVAAFRQLTSVGGFVYLAPREGGELQVCQATALSLAAPDEPRQLHFGGPTPLGKFAAVMRDSLQRAGRLHAVTVPALLETGVRFFSWLHANEKLGLPLEGAWPDGGFAYFFETDDGLSSSSQDCVFFLSQGPPLEEESLPTHGAEFEEEGLAVADEGSKGRRGFTRRRRSRGGGKPGDADEAKREPSGFDGLYCTDDPTLLPVCAHVLVYLNGDTHTDPVHSAALHRQLDEIIKAKHHLVLVHENRAEFHGRSFARIIESTPKGLVRDESGAKRLYQASE